MDASSTAGSIGRSLWTDVRFYRYRHYIKFVQWRPRMDDSNKMVDIVSGTSSGHDTTYIGR